METRLGWPSASGPIRDWQVNKRDHYAALDGLRAFAAVSVVLFHLGHWLHAPWLATNSHLAVDVFFCLSGFVLPLAYEDRLGTDLSLTQFLRIRLIRLMPLTALATVISAVYVLFRWRVNGSPHSNGELLLATFLGIVNVPFLSASSAIGGPQVFPLNGPQYSLFLEMVVNVFWSVSRRFFQPWLSLGIFAGCLLLLPVIGLGGDEAATFWSGFPRVGVSFFAGVLIYYFEKRYLLEVDLRLAFWLSTILMTIIFYYPDTLPLNVHLVWIAFISPVVVLTGSRVRLSGAWRSVALLGGALSYPIYALHYSIFCWLNGIYQFVSKQPQNIFVEGPLLLVGILLGSWAVLRYFDEPLRSALTRAAWLPGATKPEKLDSPSNVQAGRL
jgi:peptidoglycan/LPS O-acetylase OafA/YrhL